MMKYEHRISTFGTFYGQFGMKKSPVRKGYGYESLQPGQFLKELLLSSPGSSTYAKPPGTL